MKAGDMQPGRQYRLNKDNQEVECSRLSASGQFMIVHPPGEPDMQSSFGVPLEEDVEPLTVRGICPRKNASTG